MPTAARDTEVDRDALLAFVRTRHRYIVGTTRRDGRIQLSPVTGRVDADGRLVISSYPERAKTTNLRRNPAATVMVLSDEYNGEWVQVYGTGEVLDLPEALEPLCDYYRSISGEHPDWNDYREAMQRQGKVLLRITVDDWGPVSRGGFPPRLLDD